MAELFLRFKAHYGFEVTFCNPYAGYEKGNVENKVGYFRRNIFVPLPTVTEVHGFDSALEAMDEAAKSGRFTSAASMVLAARLATFEPEGITNVDLSVYDAMLEPIGGERQ
jgi:hypothetical protein